MRLLPIKYHDSALCAYRSPPRHCHRRSLPPHHTGSHHLCILHRRTHTQKKSSGWLWKNAENTIDMIIHGTLVPARVTPPTMRAYISILYVSKSCSRDQRSHIDNSGSRLALRRTTNSPSTNSNRLPISRKRVAKKTAFIFTPVKFSKFTGSNRKYDERTLHQAVHVKLYVIKT